MVDYIRDIGGASRLMIRDLGSTVEFWFQTGSASYNYNQPWSYGANGGNTGTLQFRLVKGGHWQFMGSTTVTYDQTIRLTIIGSGLGFPTYDFYQHIQRTTAPAPPHIFNTTAVSSTHIHVQFSGSYDGGSPVLEYQIGYGSNPNAPEAYWSSDGNSMIGAFDPGQYVYFWARGRNAVGWGGWSNRTETSTWRVPDAPLWVGYLVVQQTMVRTQFADRGQGGTPILERQYGYGKNPAAPTLFLSASNTGQDNVVDLDPGQTYYFWVRSRNAVGWGPWSERSQINLIAGARIFVDNQWKRAVPYVKVGGVWRVVRPWVRSGGEWKETST